MSCFFFPRFIGPVFIDVVLEEKAEASMEIPTHPVERGAKISDHAWRMPKTLTMECLNSDMTGAWGSLNALMEQAEPFDVLSGFDLFPNMMIESIEPKRDIVYSQVLFSTVTLKEVIIVNSAGGMGNIGTGGDQRGQGLTARGAVQALPVDTGSALGGTIASQVPAG